MLARCNDVYNNILCTRPEDGKSFFSPVPIDCVRTRLGPEVGKQIKRENCVMTRVAWRIRTLEKTPPPALPRPVQCVILKVYFVLFQRKPVFDIIILYCTCFRLRQCAKPTRYRFYIRNVFLVRVQSIVNIIFAVFGTRQFENGINIRKRNDSPFRCRRIASSLLQNTKTMF